MLTKLIRKLTKKYWQEEIDVYNSIAKIEELHATPEKMDVHIKSKPELQTYMAKIFASMVLESPNYTEVKFDMHPNPDNKYEWITVLVQKGNGKTPHQMRQAAEEELKHYQKLYQEFVSKSLKE